MLVLLVWNILLQKYSFVCLFAEVDILLVNQLELLLLHDLEVVLLLHDVLDIIFGPLQFVLLDLPPQFFYEFLLERNLFEHRSNLGIDESFIDDWLLLL